MSLSAGARRDLSALLEIARDAVEAGGRAILALGADGRVPVTKKDGSPVTPGDMASNAAVLRAIQAASDIPIVSEETAARDWQGRRVWMVDPLDGTKEYVGGRDDFTVNVALLEDGRPIAGAVARPSSDDIYLGADGLGAWIEHAGTRTPLATREPSSPLAAVASRSHADEETAAFLKANDVGDVVSCGSSLKFCRVAEGAADVYPRFGPTMAWDTAAAHAVLLGAGGCVVDRAGEPLVYTVKRLRNPSFFALGRHSLLLSLTGLGD